MKETQIKFIEAECPGAGRYQNKTINAGNICFFERGNDKASVEVWEIVFTLVGKTVVSWYFPSIAERERHLSALMKKWGDPEWMR